MLLMPTTHTNTHAWVRLASLFFIFFSVWRRAARRLSLTFQKASLAAEPPCLEEGLFRALSSQAERTERKFRMGEQKIPTDWQTNDLGMDLFHSIFCTS
ncbi:hypothetical protein B0T25DRAFT_157883 [Lasiosphaeria hispida]|uniref:Uncharacterized protein n=1 Tax=Lasiosphaeria hispida TaxID=260671 RepID=A0AAJ0MG61_9PEZI|nr:hypothetical protein B0T25DRAFT_157883 [Lasiosphaeria hispida]